MRPKSDEAASYYFTYIDRVSSDDVVSTLQGQLDETTTFLSGISDEKSLHRYGEDKWSIRELISHVNDAERIFTCRALWFARGFEEPLPSFDQNICVAHAAANDVSWSNHIDEFRAVRSASVELFRNLSPEAWDRSGIASDNRFTVRALAYIIAGHVSHHLDVIRERYL